MSRGAPEQLLFPDTGEMRIEQQEIDLVRCAQARTSSRSAAWKQPETGRLAMRMARSMAARIVEEGSAIRMLTGMAKRWYRGWNTAAARDVPAERTMRRPAAGSK